MAIRTGQRPFPKAPSPYLHRVLVTLVSWWLMRLSIRSPIVIRIEVDAGRVLRVVENLRSHRVPQWRRVVGETIARRALERVIELNPVDTARARAGWVRALAELGGSPPAEWRGPQPEGDAIAEGFASAATTVTEDSERTEITATSLVEYVVYLEYGTRKMSAFEMVQRGLSETAAMVGVESPSLF